MRDRLHGFKTVLIRWPALGPMNPVDLQGAPGTYKGLDCLEVGPWLRRSQADDLIESGFCGC